jgi:hypothetical protein
MRRGATLVAVALGFGVAGTAPACSLIYKLDGFDSSGAGGADAGHAHASSGTGARPPADAAHETDVSDALEPDAPPDVEVDAGFCVGQTDGTTCAAPMDGCHGSSTCKGGACMPGPTLPESTNWDPSNPQARCCGGFPMVANKDDNCNVCGITCNTSLGQKCMQQGGNPPRFQCTFCQANSECWSGCCASSLGPPGVCADSDCQGNCPSPNICPPGAMCEHHFNSDNKSNVCVY